MKKRILSLLICMAVLFSCTPFAFAAEGNMDGDGGGMGSGTGENVWYVGNDGVRITAINKETQQVVGNSFDWTNITPVSGVISFVKRNKLQYMKGANLAPNVNQYVFNIAPAGMPHVISSNSSSNIAAVKSYFTEKTIVELMANDASISYDKLISGKFTILIEPIAYFKYNGLDWAMTATEAALLDRLESGNLRKAMGTLTHQNQPLAMFLERSELGIDVWSGGGGIVSNENIIRYLGVGTVNFGNETAPITPPIVETYDYEYRADTDVVTAITVSTSYEINPDSPGRARFNLPNSTITKEYVIPEGESQLVWVKWRTPDENTTVQVPVDLNHGYADKAILNIKITKLEEDTPPDPDGRDRLEGFRLKSHPADERISSLTWGEWWAEWHENWVWVSEECDDDDEFCTSSHGYWEDQGWWDYFWRSYTATLSVTARTFPDDSVPTAVERYGRYDMKSSYGINTEVRVNMNTNGGSANTAEVQHIISVFPEFDYDTYNRLLVPDDGRIAYNATWEFKPNEYSQFVNPVHYTPVHYPDGTDYPVTFTVLDGWTPAGMLTYVITANDITINGSGYDDWHGAPGFGRDHP